jgi:hypothetical protein
VSDAVFARDREDADDLQLTAQASIAAGKIWQLRDGRAAWFTGLAGAVSPQTVKFLPRNQMLVPKSSGYCFLDGGPVFWDRLNAIATYKRLGSNRGFFLGSAIGDIANAATSLAVNFGVAPIYDIDLLRQPFTTVPIGTQAAGGFGPPGYRGGGLDLLLTNTNQAQKCDALGVDEIVTGSKGIVELAFRVIDGGASTHAKFFFGLASATHATDPTAVAEYLLAEIDSNSSKIQLVAGDGTHTLAETDTLKTYTVGTRHELWLDLRVPGLVTMYVDGVQVLVATTINLSAGASNLYLLAWLGKSSSTDTMEVAIDRARARTAEQSINGV